MSLSILKSGRGEEPFGGELDVLLFFRGGDGKELAQAEFFGLRGFKLVLKAFFALNKLMLECLEAELFGGELK